MSEQQTVAHDPAEHPHPLRGRRSWAIALVLLMTASSVGIGLASAAPVSAVAPGSLAHPGAPSLSATPPTLPIASSVPILVGPASGPLNGVSPSLAVRLSGSQLDGGPEPPRRADPDLGCARALPGLGPDALGAPGRRLDRLQLVRLELRLAHRRRGRRRLLLERDRDGDQLRPRDELHGRRELPPLPRDHRHLPLDRRRRDLDDELARPGDRLDDERERGLRGRLRTGAHPHPLDRQHLCPARRKLPALEHAAEREPYGRFERRRERPRDGGPVLERLQRRADRGGDVLRDLGRNERHPPGPPGDRRRHLGERRNELGNPRARLLPTSLPKLLLLERVLRRHRDGRPDHPGERDPWVLPRDGWTDLRRQELRLPRRRLDERLLEREGLVLRPDDEPAVRLL